MESSIRRHLEHAEAHVDPTAIGPDQGRLAPARRQLARVLAPYHERTRQHQASLAAAVSELVTFTADLRADHDRQLAGLAAEIRRLAALAASEQIVLDDLHDRLDDLAHRLELAASGAGPAAGDAGG